MWREELSVSVKLEANFRTDAGAEHMGEARCLEIHKTLIDADMKSIIIFGPRLLPLRSLRHGFHTPLT